MSWDNIEDTEQKPVVSEYVRLMSDVFNTEAGEKLLKEWIEKYVNQPIANPKDDLLSVGIKQGQANMVLMIKLALKQLKRI